MICVLREVGQVSPSPHVTTRADVTTAPNSAAQLAEVPRHGGELHAARCCPGLPFASCTAGELNPRPQQVVLFKLESIMLTDTPGAGGEDSENVPLLSAVPFTRGTLTTEQTATKDHYVAGTVLGVESAEMKGASLLENSETSGTSRHTDKSQSDTGGLQQRCEGSPGAAQKSLTAPACLNAPRLL